MTGWQSGGGGVGLKPTALLATTCLKVCMCGLELRSLSMIILGNNFSPPPKSGVTGSSLLQDINDTNFRSFSFGFLKTMLFRNTISILASGRG